MHISHCYLHDEGRCRTFVREGEGIIPTDLGALIWCEKNGRSWTPPEVFQDLEVYRAIFRPTLRRVVAACRNWDHFPDPPTAASRPEVTPLFCVLEHLTVLIGGVFLKIYELEAIRRVLPSALLIESWTQPAAQYPPLRYGDLLAALSGVAPQVPPESCPRPSAPPLGPRRLMSRALRGARNLRSRSMAFNCGETRTLVEASALGAESVVRALRAAGNQGARLLWENENPPAWDAKRPLLRCAIDTLVRQAHADLPARVASQVPLDWAMRAVTHSYGVMEPLWDAVVQQAHMAARGPRGAKRAYLARSPVTLYQRLCAYRQYAHGAACVFQEYSDGYNIGLVERVNTMQRGSLIGTTLLYANETALQAYKTAVLELVSPLRPAFVNVGTRIPTPGVTRPPRQRRLCYLPTTFSGQLRIGPDREMHDLAYLQVQRGILRTLQSITDSRVTYKAHPKQVNIIKGLDLRALIPYPDVEIRLDNISAIADDFDVFVTDSFGSGAQYCWMQGRPLVYLDFGLPAFSQDARAVLEKGVAWVHCQGTAGAWQDALRTRVTTLLENLRPWRGAPHQITVDPEDVARETLNAARQG